MKLNIPVLLATLFSSLGSAADNCLENTCVTMGEIPSQLSVGQQVRLSWSNDRDYVRTPYITSTLISTSSAKSFKLFPSNP